MDSNGSLNVLIFPYAFLLVFMGPYSSVWILTSPKGSLQIFIRPYRSLLVLMHVRGF